MTLYIVTDWMKKYENNRTRELKRMDWVPIPNKQDGDGYTELVTMQDGAGLFGCWISILQIASKCNPRGQLIRDNGEPHSAQSLSRMSHLPSPLMARTLLALVQIRWLDSVPYEIPAESRTAMRDDAVPSLPFHSVPFPEGESLREGGVKPPKAKPTIEEVRLYCAKSGIVESDADWFFYKCEGNGWTNAGKPIKQWGMTLLSWKHAGYLPSQKTTYGNHNTGRSPRENPRNAGIVKGPTDYAATFKRKAESGAKTPLAGSSVGAGPEVGGDLPTTQGNGGQGL